MSAAPAVDWVRESEVRVLAQLVTHSEAPPRVFDAIADRLAADDFADATLGAFYAAAATLVEDGAPIVVPNVLRVLGESGRRDADAIRAALVSISDHGYPRLSEKTLASLVINIRRASKLRRARRLAQEIMAAPGDAEVGAVIATASDGLARLASESVDDVPDLDVGRLLDEAADALRHAEAGQGNILRTGLIDLDRVFTAGLAPRSVTVLAALTSRGKTSLAMQIADARAAQMVARGEPGVVRVCSLEMGEVELDKRRLAAESRVPFAVWENRAPARGDEPGRLQRALAELKRRPLRMTCGGSLTVEHVRAIARRDAARHGLSLLVLDYLQALEPARKDDTREREVARMARALKALAMDLDVPVLALAQLSRAADQHERPSLSHLRESGAIEQFADNVLFIYQRQKDPANVLTVRVGKQRNGARDVECRVRFNGALFRFEDLAEDEEERHWQR